METFRKIATDMRLHRMKLPSRKVAITIPQARTKLTEAITYFIKHDNRPPEWLPEYDAVVAWLENNKGKGLFMYGDSGRGKSLLGRYVLPALLLAYCGKVASVFDMQELNRDIDTALTKHIISIDDVGTEEISVVYGQRRLAFAEIMDAAEKQNKLIIVSTNLSVEKLKNTYGDRIVDRIRTTTTQVLFKGTSLRK